VVTQRERSGEISGKRLEAAEMTRPRGFAHLAKPDAVRRAVVQEARNAFGKVRRFDRIVEVAAERQ
jgi:hypothetical protein